MLNNVLTVPMLSGNIALMHLLSTSDKRISPIDDKATSANLKVVKILSFTKPRLTTSSSRCGAVFPHASPNPLQARDVHSYARWNLNGTVDVGFSCFKGMPVTSLGNVCDDESTYRVSRGAVSELGLPCGDSWPNWLWHTVVKVCRQRRKTFLLL